MDIKAFRGLKGTYHVKANDLVALDEFIECEVQFLNNTHHKFILDRRSKGQCLLDDVFKFLNLIETDFFGLKYLPHESHGYQNDQAIANNNTNINLSQQQQQLLTKTQSLNSYDQHSSSSPNASLSSSSATNVGTSISNHDSHLHHHLGADSPSLLPTSTTITATSTVEAASEINTNGFNHNNNNNSTVANHNKSSSFCNSNSSPKQHSTSIVTTATTTTPDNNNISTFIEERWLDPSKSIRKQYKYGPPYKFYFRVKFYVSDPCKLADDTTRNHLYLQLRQDILNNRLVVPTCSAILLASYILQSEVGDYKQELQQEDYASNFKLLPNQSDDIRKKVIELHKQHKSLSPADAEYQFLLHAAKKLDCYGVEFYDAKDSSKTHVQIGVSSNGIVVFKDNKRTNQFSWAKIIKIMFKKKIFSIQMRKEDREICDTFIEYNLLSNQACKSFWEECVAQHSFFGLHQPKSPPKKFFSFLNFGSKFQYNGKTEYQTMEEIRKRSFSHFSRTLSKRYARRTVPMGQPPWSGSINQDSKKVATSVDNCENQHNNNNSLNSVQAIPDSLTCSLTVATSTANSSGIFNHPSSSKTIDHHEVKTLEESINYIRKGLEKKEEEEKARLIEEFEQMSRKNEDETSKESKLVENIDKNRYRDILPYDSTRVQLIDSMTGDYINASFVNMAVPSGAINRYIATQGPLETTCDDFWQMVWEQNCSLIIMVTPLVEAGRVKCHKYWPDEKEEVRYGQIVVRNLNEKSKTATIGRTIQLLDVKSGEKRITSQIQYKAWPDHEIPEDCSDFLKLVNRVRKHRLSKPNDPIVVHCSAGIGRTGVLILMETAICIMESGEPIYPIKILDDMRRQRAMLIQTNSQFMFVADAICKVYEQKLYKKRKRKKK